jgi:deazaflavin-dependent oxidoreductase (nitroreductase family)
MDRPHNINSLRRALHRLLMSSVLSPVFARILHRADGFVLHLNGGRFTITSLIAGLPTILLTTIGAKSGLPRVLPIACVPDGEKYALVASNFGQSHFPSWYHNLKKNSECIVRVGDTIRTFIAREIHDDEYESYWNMAVNIYEGYAAYKQRTSRRIPVMLLEPKKY